jgi:hypothetical protein
MHVQIPKPLNDLRASVTGADVHLDSRGSVERLCWTIADGLSKSSLAPVISVKAKCCGVVVSPMSLSNPQSGRIARKLKGLLLLLLPARNRLLAPLSVVRPESSETQALHAKSAGSTAMTQPTSVAWQKGAA